MKAYQELFPFWTEHQIRRIIEKLEKAKVILTRKYEKNKYNQTKWYTIIDKKVCQIYQIDMANLPNREGKNHKSRHIINTYNKHLEEQSSSGMNSLDPKISRSNKKELECRVTLDSSSSSQKDKEEIPYKEIVDYLNKVCLAKFRASTQATRRLIHARWEEGFRLTDFKKVIDIKAAQWLEDNKMYIYLRPQTLFGTKFESYLNEVVE